MNKKFGRDLMWSYISFAILAISGILINLIIARRYGSDVLGVFNQVFAIYTIASQFAVGGIHYSVLKEVAGLAHDSRRRGEAGCSAILAVLLVGAPIASLIFLLSGVIGKLMNSYEVGAAMALAAPGLAFFALNKVLLGIFNGLRRMREFAIGQATRYLLMISYVLVVASLDLPGYWFGATFTVAEVLLACVLLVMVVPHVPLARGPAIWNDLKGHILFGLKGFMSGVIRGCYNHIDVVMLGLFMSDHMVGLYSFASMLAEGFYSLLGVVRNNVNPILVQLLKENRLDEIRSMVFKLQRYVYVVIAGLGGLLLGLYGPAIHFFFGNSEFLQSWSVLAIIMVGLFFCSGYVPFDFILLQAGQPGHHTLFTSMNLGSIILLNILLIPLLGIHGAAMAKALTLSLSVFFLHWMTYRHLSLRLGTPFG